MWLTELQQGCQTQNQHIHAVHTESNTTKQGIGRARKRTLLLLASLGEGDDQAFALAVVMPQPRYQSHNTHAPLPYTPYVHRREASWLRLWSAIHKQEWTLPRPPPPPPPHPLHHPRRPHPHPPPCPPSLKVPPSCPRIHCAHPWPCSGTILLRQPPQQQRPPRPPYYVSSPAPRGPWQEVG